MERAVAAACGSTDGVVSVVAVLACVGYAGGFICAVLRAAAARLLQGWQGPGMQAEQGAAVDCVHAWPSLAEKNLWLNFCGVPGLHC